MSQSPPDSNQPTPGIEDSRERMPFLSPDPSPDPHATPPPLPDESPLAESTARRLVPPGIDLAPAAAPVRPKGDRPSSVQFVFSLIAMIGLVGVGLIFGLMGLFNASLYGGADQFQTATLLIQASGIVACGLMLIPSVYHAYRRMDGRALPSQSKPFLGLHPLVPLLLWGVVLAAGFVVTRYGLLPTLLMPPIQVLAVVLPVLFILILGTRGLPVGSAQRRAGVFAVGLVLGPFLSITVEFLAIIAIMVIATFVLLNQPGMIEEFLSSLERLSVYTVNPEELMRQFAPLLVKPASITLILLFTAVLAPLTEELIKPIGVWFLARRELSGAEGFTAGLLSGAGFAVLESIAVNTAGESWLEVAVARGGTAIIHILTTALTGWALALAWKKRRYSQLVFTFLGVLIIHGTWNAMAMLATLNNVAVEGGVALNSRIIPFLGSAAPYVLIAMTASGFIGLLLANRKLRRSVKRSQLA